MTRRQAKWVVACIYACRCVLKWFLLFGHEPHLFCIQLEGDEIMTGLAPMLYTLQLCAQVAIYYRVQWNKVRGTRCVDLATARAAQNMSSGGSMMLRCTSCRDDERAPPFGIHRQLIAGPSLPFPFCAFWHTSSVDCWSFSSVPLLCLLAYIVS